MKISRISFLFLLVFLLVPSMSYAQSAANKSWKPFWTQFTVAVKSKNKAAVKRLMSSNFIDDLSGTSTGDEWLKMLDDNKLWGWIQKSVAKGTVARVVYNEDDKPGRTTKDGLLNFQYIGGKWLFVGISGD